MERSAGILLPVFSLPSDYGMGSLGGSARDFVDFLSRAGQRWWQILPVVPPGAGNSPYSSSSTHAGDPMLIDPQLLYADGLVTAEELAEAAMPRSSRVDYGAVRAKRETLLRRAFAAGFARDAEAVRAFEAAQPWVSAYALYMACREHFGGQTWQTWPDEALRRYEPDAVRSWREKLDGEVAYHIYCQYLFDLQWQALKDYANERGVGIIGDLPFYVSSDSADVWSERTQFLLDGEGYPCEVAGVPPDYFCEDGQLWGNPLYNWDVMRADGYGWWIRRVGSAARRFDAVRIDHFRAFESYWAVPAGSETARAGQWRPGPGLDLVERLIGWFGGMQFIAEDLGIVTPAVEQLLRDSGLPGMRVLEFAFSGPDNAYLPHNHTVNCICYTGTHDNNTLRGWYDTAAAEEKAYVRRYLGARGADAVRRAALRAGMGSVASVFVAQLQDWLGLGGEARINVPGVGVGNWEWRLESDCLPGELAAEIRGLTETYGRCSAETGEG